MHSTVLTLKYYLNRKITHSACNHEGENYSKICARSLNVENKPHKKTTYRPVLFYKLVCNKPTTSATHPKAFIAGHN